MKTNLPRALGNILLAGLFSVVLWLMYGDYVPTPFFLVPFFWLWHVLSLYGRVEEVYELVSRNNELLLWLASKDPNFNAEDFSDDIGLDDDYA